MLRHAGRAVPWWLVGTCSALAWVLMAAVRYDPFVLWPLQGVAVGVVAAGVAWCLDEPAAAVVDAAPRSLAWRTAARWPGIALVLGAWCLAVWQARDHLFGYPMIVLAQGWIAGLVALSWATWRRAAGEASPGSRAAIVVVATTAVWALVRPAQTWVPVFPYADGGRYGDWTVSALLWAVAGVAAAVLLAAALSESRRFRQLSTRRSHRDRDLATREEGGVLLAVEPLPDESVEHSDR